LQVNDHLYRAGAWPQEVSLDFVLGEEKRSQTVRLRSTHTYRRQLDAEDLKQVELIRQQESSFKPVLFLAYRDEILRRAR
jgi:hypothetical protein